MCMSVYLRTTTTTTSTTTAVTVSSSMHSEVSTYISSCTAISTPTSKK